MSQTAAPHQVITSYAEMSQTAAPHQVITSYTDFAVLETPHPQGRYTSGRTIYVESSDGERWLGRFWSADGRINVLYESWAEDAFRLEIDHQMLSTGWRWTSTSEAATTERGARHLVVELSNTRHPINVKVHTLLDGTPVLTRWLEITNQSERPVALTAVAPWSGRLWPGRNFTLGYFTKDIWACEGWFEWKPLPKGTTTVKCDKGQGFDDPFFIVRNEVTGEYFIGHLAWSANWQLDFRRDDAGLLFAISPDAVPAQRVIAPAETIATPAVHMGHVSGSLDTVVQALHEHLRGFVLPIRKAERFGLIQYLVPADQGYYKPFDEASILKCVDVAAAIGAELFILDAYWWDITPDWIPSADRFPRGLEPVINFVHRKGMLFGLYVEPEAGRGRVTESKVYNLTFRTGSQESAWKEDGKG